MYHLKWVLGVDERTLVPSPQIWLEHVGGSARAGKLVSFPPLKLGVHYYPTIFRWVLLTRACTITEIILNSTIAGIVCLTQAVLRTQDHCPSARAPCEARIELGSAATIDQERSWFLCFEGKFGETLADGSSRRQHSANTFSNAGVSQSCVPIWTSIDVSRLRRQKRVECEFGR